MKWEVIKTIWPYEEGYGVYSPETKIVVEVGMLKEQAQAICDAMNGKERDL